MSKISIGVKLLLLTAAVLYGAVLAEAASCPPQKYYDVSTSKCEFCHVSCDGCNGSGNTNCVKCAEGFGMSQHHYFKGCVLESAEPSKYLDFKTQTFKKSSKTCGQSIESATNCNPCKSSHEYYRPDTDTCVDRCPLIGGYSQFQLERKCTPCRDPNCLACNHDGQCFQCRSFWNLDEKSGRCLRECRNGCSQCDDLIGICSRCEDGWTLSLGLCKCQYQNCRSCSLFKCTECLEGYVLNSQTGHCILADINCIKFEGDTSKCMVCNHGHTLINGKCSPCPAGCRYCTASGKCTACENGYFMDEARENNCTQITKPTMLRINI